MAYFGILKAGMTALPLNPLLTAAELVYHLADADARLLVTFEGFLEETSRAAGEAGVPAYVVGANVPEGQHRAEDLFSAEPLVEP
ncbi:MAG: AMP-binding protein [Marmoricola sp.]